MRRGILGLIILALAACDTPRPHPFVVPSPFQIATPFAQADQNADLLGSIAETTSIAVEPVEGLAPESNDLLRRQIANAAVAQDMPVSVGVIGHSADRLVGTLDIQAARDRGLVGRVHWRLLDTNDDEIDRFSVNAPLRTNTSDARWRDVISAATVNALERSLNARPWAIANLVGRSADASTGQGLPLFVPDVIGAPGDGNTSLARAVRALLDETGLDVADAPAAARYRLQGNVQLGSVLADNTFAQPIAISWDLYAPDGRHLGNIAQQNLIEPGSLDGRWGDIAIFAAMGAVEGIRALMGSIPPESR